jgi:hypothetical protein
MKLNGWIRIGIVLSILWVAWIGGYAVCEYFQHQPQHSIFIAWRAAKTGEDYVTLAKTTGMFADLVPLSGSLRVSRFLAFLFIPLAIAWSSSFVIVYTIIWIIRGFRMSRQSST